MVMKHGTRKATRYGSPTKTGLPANESASICSFPAKQLFVDISINEICWYYLRAMSLRKIDKQKILTSWNIIAFSHKAVISDIDRGLNENWKHYKNLEYPGRNES